jgi:hypothetical protein
VISDSSSSCFAGKILFCASVATPYPFIDNSWDRSHESCLD